MARTEDYEYYYDEFGEVITDNTDGLEDDDELEPTATEEMIPDESGADDINQGDEFHETLRTDVSDQMDDPALQAEAEDDFADADGIDDEDRVKPAAELDDELAA